MRDYQYNAILRKALWFPLTAKKTLLSLVISLPAKQGTTGFVVSQGAQFHIMKNYLKSNAINIFLLTKVLIKNQDTSIQSLPIFSILPLII